MDKPQKLGGWCARLDGVVAPSFELAAEFVAQKLRGQGYELQPWNVLAAAAPDQLGQFLAFYCEEDGQPHIVIVTSESVGRLAKLLEIAARLPGPVETHVVRAHLGAKDDVFHRADTALFESGRLDANTEVAMLSKVLPEAVPILNQSLGASIDMDAPESALVEIDRLFSDVKQVHSVGGLVDHLLMTLSLFAGEAARRLAPGSGWQWRSCFLVDDSGNFRFGDDDRPLRAGPTLGDNLAAGGAPHLEGPDGRILDAVQMARHRMEPDDERRPLATMVREAIAHLQRQRVADAIASSNTEDAQRVLDARKRSASAYRILTWLFIAGGLALAVGIIVD